MNVYLDYAATTPLDPEILEKMMPYLTEEYGNPDSLHGYGRRAAHAVTEARDRIAAVLGVKPTEVYFTSGGTEANNWAARCLGHGRVVTSSIEHTSLFSSLVYRQSGFSVVETDISGVASPGSFERDLLPGTGLVCLMAVNNETGSIQPVKEVAQLAHARHIPLFSDCVQAASSQDLKEIMRYADAISLSGHKLYGPKGIGALVVKRGTHLKRLLVGGEQEKGLRAGTQSVANIVGFSYALERAQAMRKAFNLQAEALKNFFLEEFQKVVGEGMTIDGENCVPNILHATFEKGGQAILSALDLCGIACSGGAACSAHAKSPSHVMLAMGRTEEEAMRGVRFSFGRHTTPEEIVAVVRALGFCLRS